MVGYKIVAPTNHGGALIIMASREHKLCGSLFKDCMLKIGAAMDGGEGESANNQWFQPIRELVIDDQSINNFCPLRGFVCNI